MRIQGIKGMNWLMYKQFCNTRGLKQDNFKSLEYFIKGGYENDNKIFIQI